MATKPRPIPYEDSISLQHAMRMRELFQYSDEKLSSYGSNYYLSSRWLPNISNKPYLNDNFYPRHSQFRENDFIYSSHPYRKAEKFPSLGGMGIAPSHLQYPDRSFNYYRNRSSEKSFLFPKKFYKGFYKKPYRRTPEPKQPPFKDEPSEQITIKSEENGAAVKSNVIKYCLDRETQYTIKNLQKDFRLTKKYKTFTMYEMPIIADFRPTPVMTANKFNDRFKCLSQEPLDLNALNVDHDAKLEKNTKKPDVSAESVTTEVADV